MIDLPTPTWKDDEYGIYLFHGDCLDILPQLPDGCVDLVLTDPPYGHNNNNGDLIANREAALGRGKSGSSRAIAGDGAEANDLFCQSIHQWNRLLSAGCCCCCCGGGGGPDPQFARWSLWLDEVFNFKQMIVWDKGPMGMGWHYRRSYETVLVSQKHGGKCRWYDTTAAVENIIRPHSIKDAVKIIPTASEHPTLKPVGLMAHFVDLHTMPDHVVLDSFMGSGTTGVACVGTSRKFIGIEIEQKHFDIAVERIRKAIIQYQGGPMFAEHAPEQLVFGAESSVK